MNDEESENDTLFERIMKLRRQGYTFKTALTKARRDLGWKEQWNDTRQRWEWRGKE